MIKSQNSDVVEPSVRHFCSLPELIVFQIGPAGGYP